MKGSRKFRSRGVDVDDSNNKFGKVAFEIYWIKDLDKAFAKIHFIFIYDRRCNIECKWEKRDEYFNTT